MSRFLALIVLFAGLTQAQYNYFADNTINFLWTPPAGWGAPNWGFNANDYQYASNYFYWSEVPAGNSANGNEIQLTAKVENNAVTCACAWFKMTYHSSDNTYSYYSMGMQWTSYVNNGIPTITIYRVNHNVVTVLAQYNVAAPVDGDLVAASLQLSDIGGPSRGLTVRYKGVSYYARDTDTTMPTTGRNGIVPGGGLSRVQMGTVDTTAPAAVNANSIQSTWTN